MIDQAFVCNERHGTHIRRVVEVEPTKELEDKIRARLGENESPVKDMRFLYLPGVRILLVDDVGIIVKSSTLLGKMCDVHVGFWDRTLCGREDMCRRIASQLASDGNYTGVWTAIPLKSRATLAFAKRVGFTELGRTEALAVLTLVT